MKSTAKLSTSGYERVRVGVSAAPLPMSAKSSTKSIKAVRFGVSCIVLNQHSAECITYYTTTMQISFCVLSGLFLTNAGGNSFVCLHMALKQTKELSMHVHSPVMVSSLVSDETLKTAKNSQVTYKTNHYKCNTDDF